MVPASGPQGWDRADIATCYAANASSGSAFVLCSGSLSWIRRPRLASPASTTEVVANHPRGVVKEQPPQCRGRTRGPTSADPAVTPSARRPLRLSGRVPGSDGVALVVEPAAPGHCQLHLGPPLLEVDRQRHQCQRVLLRPSGQLGDLAPVEEQLAGPARVVAAEPLGEVVR